MIEKILRDKYGDYIVGLDIYENRGSLILSRIIVKPESRGSGIGKKIMSDLITYADNNKQIVALTPSSDFGGNKNRLIQFYKSFGFKLNKGYHKSYEFREAMIRYPKLSEIKKLIKNLLRENLNRPTMLFKEESEISSCDCCKYFDMENIKNTYSGLEHPLYYIINKDSIEKLKYISPEKYIHAVADGFGVSYDEAIKYVKHENVKKYAADMKRGDKFPVGFYKDNKSSQEGRHRALAAMSLGCEYIPVVVITEINYMEKLAMIKPLVGMTREELDQEFKSRGYHGITNLDYSNFERFVEYNIKNENK